jgi:hypothetical protein
LFLNRSNQNRSKDKGTNKLSNSIVISAATSILSILGACTEKSKNKTQSMIQQETILWDSLWMEANPGAKLERRTFVGLLMEA